MRPLLLALLLLPPAPVPEGAVTGKATAVEGAKHEEIRKAIRYVGAGIEQHDKKPDPSFAVVWLEGVAPAKAEPVKLDIKQERIEFRPRVVAVPVGSTIGFPNLDKCFHNVFSHRTANKSRIDLGRYRTGDTKEIVFDRAGKTFLRCDIHKHMQGYIHVFDHPYFALAAADGAFSIPKVPPGKYTLVAWKEDFDEVRTEVEVKADGAKVDVTLTWEQRSPGGESAAAPLCCAGR